jgi:hypothetical protein
MGINARGSVDPRWRRAADYTLSGWVNCTISLYDAQLLNDGTGYDWRTNTGANADPTLLFTGEAQMQVYRFTLVMDAPAGSVDQVRNARFTIAHTDIEGVTVRKGQRIIEDSFPNETTLEKYQYVVNSGLNSGWSFRRTIETEVDMARVMP